MFLVSSKNIFIFSFSVGDCKRTESDARKQIFFRARAGDKEKLSPLQFLLPVISPVRKLSAQKYSWKLKLKEGFFASNN